MGSPRPPNDEPNRLRDYFAIDEAINLARARLHSRAGRTTIAVISFIVVAIIVVLPLTRQSGHSSPAGASPADATTSTSAKRAAPTTSFTLPLDVFDSGHHAGGAPTTTTAPSLPAATSTTSAPTTTVPVTTTTAPVAFVPPPTTAHPPPTTGPPDTGVAVPTN